MIFVADTGYRSPSLSSRAGSLSSAGHRHTVPINNLLNWVFEKLLCVESLSSKLTSRLMG